MNEGNAALVLPVITLGEFLGGVLGEGATPAPLAVPFLILNGIGASIGPNVANLSIPRITLLAFGEIGNSGNASLSLPMLSLLSNDGMGVRISLPSLALDADGVTGAVGSAILTLPHVTLSALGVAPGLYFGSNTLPLLSISATGIGGSLGEALLTLPALRAFTAGSVGTAGVMDLILPILVTSGVGYSPYEYQASLVLPALQLVASGYQSEIGEYRIWALNAHKGPLTEYSNFNFNSFANFGGSVLAAGSTGVHVLDSSSTDDGDNINASIRWGNLAYGTSFNKRIPRIYIGYRSDGYNKFITVTQGQGSREYLLPGNGNSEIQQRRMPIGKGPKSTYWQFGYENVDGADFAINSLILRPDVLRRRVF